MIAALNVLKEKSCDLRQLSSNNRSQQIFASDLETLFSSGDCLRTWIAIQIANKLMSLFDPNKCLTRWLQLQIISGNEQKITQITFQRQTGLGKLQTLDACKKFFRHDIVNRVIYMSHLQRVKIFNQTDLVLVLIMWANFRK